MEYILASASPRRKELLAMLDIPFTVCVSGCDETLPESLAVRDAAEYLAVQKAAFVANEHPEQVVIGVDTTVLLDDCILGKPKDYADCVRMLHALSDRVHTVKTGVALFHQGKSMSFTEETQVQFYPLTDAEIEAYAKTDEPYDKAGGYGIQGKAALFVRGIAGDYYNVVGLPIGKLARHLRIFV